MVEDIRFLNSLRKGYVVEEDRARENPVYHLGKAYEHYKAGGPAGEMQVPSLREALRYESEYAQAQAKRRALDSLEDLNLEEG